MSSIPNFQASPFSPDPAGALADTWVFTIQMRNLFASDTGGSPFGKSFPEALSTAHQIEGLCMSLVRAVTSPEEFARAQGRIEPWAAERPISDLTFHRRSIYPALKVGALRAGVDGLSALEGVSTMSMQIEHIEGHLTLFNKYLPNRIRGQFDLATEKVLRGLDEEAAVESLVKLGDAAEAIRGESLCPFLPSSFYAWTSSRIPLLGNQAKTTIEFGRSLRASEALIQFHNENPDAGSCSEVGLSGTSFRGNAGIWSALSRIERFERSTIRPVVLSSRCVPSGL